MFKPLFYLFVISLLTSFCAYSQLNPDFFISNYGNDFNTGKTKLLPKKTIVGSLPVLQSFATQTGSVSIGLAGNSVFSETFIPAYPVKITTYNDTASSHSFATLQGSEVFDKGWQLETGTINTWSQNITYTGFNGSGINAIGGYSYLYVIEIDKELEKTAPYTARKILDLAPSKQAVETMAGSFYEPVSNNNPVPIYIHSSDGGSPNNHAKYRYEVAVRDKGVDAYIPKDNVFENIWVHGYGAGYGLLPAGSNTRYNKVIFGPGAGIHHAVTKNALFSNCLFLPGIKNAGKYAIVFYDLEGLQRHNKIKNTLFLDVSSPIYAHTSNGTNYGAVELDHVFSFTRDDLGGEFLSTGNTDTVLLNHVYTDGHWVGFYNANGKLASIRNAYFTNVINGISFGSDPIKATVENVFIKMKGIVGGTGVELEKNLHLDLKNSIISVRAKDGISTNTGGGAFVGRGGSNSAYINATGNIFIADVDPFKTVSAAVTNTDRGIGTSLDKWNNNVYILLSGKEIDWYVTNRATNQYATYTSSFTEWKRQSGQDSNSLFFDLRQDPRGLKAIFLDPDKGNYTLANTIEGNKVRALGAGMTNPLQCFLKKPTYEEAAAMIKSDKILSVDNCRNPCQKASAKVLSVFAADPSSAISVCKDQELTLKGSGNYMENETYYHQSDLKARYLWWFSDNKDTSGVNLHTVSHRFSDEKSSNVRLQMVDENGCSFDTSFTVKVVLPPVKTGIVKDTTICTGQALQLNVTRTGASDRYKWSTGDTTTAITVTTPGNYWVQVQNTGCRVADTIKVINKTPVSVALGNDTMYCASSSLVLSPKKTGNIKQFEWNTGATTDTLQVKSPGTYILTARDFGVCIARDTITVTNNPVNQFSLPADTAICAGTSYNLKLVGNQATSVTWNNGSQSFSQVIRGGSYSIAAANSGCIKRDTLLVNIKPLPVFRLPRDTTVCSGYSLPLTASYTGASYLWSTGSKESAIAVNNKGMYWAQATLNGCSYRDSITIAVQNCECRIEMPNAFSPNGDGINDDIRPNMACYPTNYTLTVFNRYGQSVFTTRNYNTPWKGDYNGKPVPVGTYYYVITYQNEGFTTNKPVTGSITVLR
jgi:gliding motility-associated-like protein